MWPSASTIFCFGILNTCMFKLSSHEAYSTTSKMSRKARIIAGLMIQDQERLIDNVLMDELCIFGRFRNSLSFKKSTLNTYLGCVYVRQVTNVKLYEHSI